MRLPFAGEYFVVRYGKGERLAVLTPLTPLPTASIFDRVAYRALVYAARSARWTKATIASDQIKRRATPADVQRAENYPLVND